MPEPWNSVLLIVAGAVIGAGASILTSWLENTRERTWVLEDKKRDRVIAAREVRLKNGEEMMGIYATILYYCSKYTVQKINAVSIIGYQYICNEELKEKKSVEEWDKGKLIYSAAIVSLGDNEITKIWQDVQSSFIAYLDFSKNLSATINSQGIENFQKDRKKYEEEEQARKDTFFSSVKMFYRRTNELRSQ